MKNAAVAIVLLISHCLCHTSLAQVRPQDYFPDTENYKTLICDLHTHTVFSDGLVWPSIRVQEARREGVDAIAITDHIEYQPHADDLPTSHNRPHQIAKPNAAELNVLLIKGAEITRDTPPGHYNAIFLDDIIPIDTEGFLDAVERANKQGAFVFWNHHAWQGPELGQWEELQTTMYENKWLHGIEVANDSTYYPDAHKWCLEKKLTMLGNSDIHSPSIDYEYTNEKHRTLTLVFAKERTNDAIKEALIAGRTAVWYNNQLIGRQEYLEPLFRASVEIAPPHHVFIDEEEEEADREKMIFYDVTNKSMIDMEIRLPGEGRRSRLRIPAQSTAILRLPEPDPETQPIQDLQAEPSQEPQTLAIEVSNFLVAPDQGMLLDLKIPATPETDAPEE